MEAYQGCVIISNGRAQLESCEHIHNMTQSSRASLAPARGHPMAALCGNAHAKHPAPPSFQLGSLSYFRHSTNAEGRDVFDSRYPHYTYPQESRQDFAPSHVKNTIMRRFYLKAHEILGNVFKSKPDCADKYKGANSSSARPGSRTSAYCSRTRATRSVPVRRKE
jgi:hypothetical protein